MANEEKTEQATPRKRQDTREKGQVAKSSEINAAVTLQAAMMALIWLGPGMIQTWSHFTQAHLLDAGLLASSDRTLQWVVIDANLNAGKQYLLMVVPLLGMILAAGASTNLIQTGFLVSTKAMAFDFSRLNPLQGLTRTFSTRSLVELLKSGAKASLIGYVIYAYFRQHLADFIGLIQQNPTTVGESIAKMSLEVMQRATWVVLGIAILDYAYQRWSFEKSIRMSRQEIKDEFKRTEGDPQIKARVRQRQREMSRRRMMADVKRATVVITNPTHLAIALRYEPGETPAPRIVAKGQRLVAERIKAIAAENNVPVVENKPVARALYEQCEIGELIPADLYQAVAEIIAFILKQANQATRRETR